MKNYWKNFADQNKWVVIGSDMDGITGYQVVHSSDYLEVKSGCYWGGLTRGLSMNKSEMQELADELNEKNEPAPDNPMRNVWHKFQ